MSRQKDYKFQKENRKRMVEECKLCDGAPPTEEKDLQGLLTTFCSTCLMVCAWKATGRPTTINKVVRSNESPSYPGEKPKETIVQFIPGINFDNLKIV